MIERGDRGNNTTQLATEDSGMQDRCPSSPTTNREIPNAPAIGMDPSDLQLGSDVALGGLGVDTDVGLLAKSNKQTSFPLIFFL